MRGLTNHLLSAVMVLLVATPCFAEPETNRFAVAGITEDQARSMFEALQSSVRLDDRTKVAALVEYPLRVNGSHTHRSIPDRGRLLSDYTRVFTRDVRERILRQSFEKLFVSSRGAMIGNGVVWFSGICDRDSAPGTCKNLRVRIIAVNLDAPDVAWRDRAFQEVSTLADVPPAIRSRLGREAGFDRIADRGECFNATDVVDRDCPRTRFLVAGRDRDTWLVVLEQGGRGYHVEALLFSSSDAAPSQKWVLRTRPTTLRDALNQISKQEGAS